MVYRQNAISMMIYYKPPDKSPRPPDKSVYWKTIFFIFHPKHMLWVLKEPSQWDSSFEHPKHMFKLMGKKIITILRS